MEVVKAFNSELSSLYEGKPPISKAKMTAITKSAIKGIKFYKHIVQSVEKFVQKCRPEYKVPGLYVVDSIVRQSRHQFGQDKDVFAPRFTKNIQNTFQHLFKCPDEDRPKIVRVLNLWQKNQVFPPDVIQPLLDMASPGAVPIADSAQSSDLLIDVKANKNSLDNWKGWNHGREPVSGTVKETKTYALTQENLNLAMAAEAENAAPPDAELLVQLQSLASQLLTNRPGGSSAAEEKASSNQLPVPAVKFNKKLLDFDYGDEEEEEEEESFEEAKPASFVEPPLEDSGGQSSEPNAIALSMAQNLLNNPELLKQLQQMQQTLQQQSSEALRAQENASSVLSTPTTVATVPTVSSGPGHFTPADAAGGGQRHSPGLPPPQPPVVPLQPVVPQQPVLAAVTGGHFHASQTAQLANAPALVTPGYPGTPSAPLLPQAFPDTGQHAAGLYPPAAPPIGAAVPPMVGGMGFASGGEPPGGFVPMTAGPTSADEPPAAAAPMEGGGAAVLPSYMSGGDLDERCGVILGPGGRDMDLRTPAGGLSSPGRDRDRRRHSRSRSPRRRGHSRSRSPSRTSGNRYSSTTKRDRSRERESRESAREKERERERERRRKGFPPVKKNYLSVCSATLWLGHVPKSVSEMDLHDTFGEFGSIVRVDMIPPRGCAFVCMDRRQDAFRALSKLKNLKLQGSLIKMAWAPGKGVKGKELKDFWEVDLGVSYIPLEKLPAEVNLLALEEGGVIDKDSLPDNLKEKYAEQERQRSMGEPLPPVLLDLAQQPQQPQTAQASAEAMMAVAFPPVAGTPVVTTMATPGGGTAVAMVPPPVPQFGIPLPPVGQGSVKTNEAQIKGMLPSQSLVMSQIQLPMGVPPPPNHMLMVSPNTSQTLLAPSALGLLPPHLGLPGAALGLPLHPPMSLPVTSQAAVVPIVTSANPTAAATQTSAAVTTPVVDSSTTDVPMAIDGDATPTDEDGTSEASRLGFVPSASGEMAAGSHKETAESAKPTVNEFSGALPSGGFAPLSAPPGVPSQFVDQGLVGKEKTDAEAAKETKSPVAGSSQEATNADVNAEQHARTDPDKMQVDEPSSGQQAAEPGQEAHTFEVPPVSSAASIPLPLGLPGMPSPPIPPRGFPGAPVRFGGPHMFPFENSADGRPGMEFPAARLMGPDPRMIVPPTGNFRQPSPHDQGMVIGPGEQRMMGGPLEQRMLDGPLEARMMGGHLEPRMHRGPEPRMLGGPPEPRMIGGPIEARMMGGPPEPRMMGGPEELRMLGGPPEHRMMGGPRDYNMMGAPVPEHRMMVGPPDHRMIGGPMEHRMGGPMEHRMMGGPPDHRMMGGPPDHRMMGGPPDHRMMVGPPDHRMMVGPPDHRMMGPPDHRMLGPPDHRMIGVPPDHRMLPGPPDHRMLRPPDFRLGGPPPGLRKLGPPEPRMLAPGPRMLAPDIPPMMAACAADLKPPQTDGKGLESQGEGHREKGAEDKPTDFGDKKAEENGEAPKEWKPPAVGPNGPAAEEQQANGEQPWKQPGFGFFGPPRSRFNEPHQSERGPDSAWSSGRDGDESGFGGGDRRVFTNAFGEVATERRRGGGRERRSRWSREDEDRESRSRSERSDRDRGDRDRSDRDRRDRDRSKDRSDRDRDRSDRDRDRSDRDRDRTDRDRDRDRSERDRDRSDKDRDRSDKDRDRSDKDRDRSDKDRDRDREKDRDRDRERDRSDRDRDRGDRDRDRCDKDKERSERSSRTDHRRSRDRDRSTGRGHSSTERTAAAPPAAEVSSNGEVSGVSSSSSKPNGSTEEVPLPKEVECKAPAESEQAKEAADQAEA